MPKKSSAQPALQQPPSNAKTSIPLQAVVNSKLVEKTAVKTVEDEKATERLWIASIKDGNEADFEKLIHKYEQKVYMHCCRVTGDEVDSRDITQEVFLKVYRNIAHYQPTYSFYTWLYRITINCCIDHIRKKRRHNNNISLSFGAGEDSNGDGKDLEIPDTKNVPDSHLEQTLLRNKLKSAIAQLSDKLRIIIILKEVEGFSYEEIAEMLGCSRGTVKSRLFRARERLREILSDAPDGGNTLHSN